MMSAAKRFRMPAEWEPHAATWIAWPYRRDDWPGKFAPIPWVYTEIVRHLTESERVRILVNDADAERRASRMLRHAGVQIQQIDFVRIPTDRSWTRDFGPMFVKTTGDGRAIVDWHFNAWAKYPDWHQDAFVPRQASEWLGVTLVEPTINGVRAVLEGGAIDVNGAGLLLTTEECLLSPIQARNPNIDRDKLKSVLSEFLGIDKIIWLGRGIVGDDTHGHVDDLARFVAPGTVVNAAETNERDANHAALSENLRRLRDATDLGGKPLNIVTLPMPKAMYFKGQRVPASYANFYIANRCVLVPTFNDPNDRIALNTLAELFPDRDVIGIHAVDLVWGLGTIHCLTQQEPA